VSADAAAPTSAGEIVARASTSGGRHWGITIGLYPTRFAAERDLLRTALAEMSALDGALRKVARGDRGFRANFVGMSEDQADRACRRLTARGRECLTLGPS
jgi:D-alanyl-D-alanine carboxypeptidase